MIHLTDDSRTSKYLYSYWSTEISWIIMYTTQTQQAVGNGTALVILLIAYFPVDKREPAIFHA